MTLTLPQPSRLALPAFDCGCQQTDAMARLARAQHPGQPHHVLIRSRSGLPLFDAVGVRQGVMDSLAEAGAANPQLRIHGYVTLRDACHLVVTPMHMPALSTLVKALRHRCTRRYRAATGDTADGEALWDGRFRSRVLVGDLTQLAAQRGLLSWVLAMDALPVWHRLAPEPLDWPWSSGLAYAGKAPQHRLAAPAAYWSLGNTPFSREAAFGAAVAEMATSVQEKNAWLRLWGQEHGRSV